MIPSSLTVILATLALGVAALAVFIVAWWRGHFRDIDAQARVIFDSRDLRFVRPWETSARRRATAGVMFGSVTCAARDDTRTPYPSGRFIHD